MSEQAHFRFAKKGGGEEEEEKKPVAKVARVVGNMHNADLTACKLFRKAIDPRRSSLVRINVEENCNFVRRFRVKLSYPRLSSCFSAGTSNPPSTWTF